MNRVGAIGALAFAGFYGVRGAKAKFHALKAEKTLKKAGEQQKQATDTPE